MEQRTVDIRKGLAVLESLWNEAGVDYSIEEEALDEFTRRLTNPDDFLPILEGLGRGDPLALVRARTAVGLDPPTMVAESRAFDVQRGILEVTVTVYGVDGIQLDDGIKLYLYKTDAPADFDNLGTVEVCQREGRRYVLIPNDRLEGQLGRYRKFQVEPATNDLSLVAPCFHATMFGGGHERQSCE